MARHKVEICGVDTASIKVLSSEEMNELFHKMQQGDKLAKEEIAQGNLKLVLSILKGFSQKTDMDDLFQVGCIGLMKAIDNFDLSVGVKFSTYAVPMILGEIKRYLRDNNSLRISRSIKDNAYMILRVKEELIQQNGKEPTIEELIAKTNLTEYEIVEAFESLRGTVSMFEPIYNDGGDTIYLADQLEDKKNKTNQMDTMISLNTALEKLRPKEKYIINERYIFGKTQVELSEELGISQAQISRLEKSGLDNLKKLIN